MKQLLATNIEDTFGKVELPAQFRSIGPAEQGINAILSNLVQLFFIVGGVSFVIMVVWAATQMITSGGDKEQIAHARSRLTWAIIGIILLGLSFVIFRIFGFITGFEITPAP